MNRINRDLINSNNFFRLKKRGKFQRWRPPGWKIANSHFQQDQGKRAADTAHQAHLHVCPFSLNYAIIAVIVYVTWISPWQADWWMMAYVRPSIIGE